MPVGPVPRSLEKKYDEKKCTFLLLNLGRRIFVTKALMTSPPLIHKPGFSVLNEANSTDSALCRKRRSRSEADAWLVGCASKDPMET